jgi:hypothetical protein
MGVIGCCRTGPIFFFICPSLPFSGIGRMWFMLQQKERLANEAMSSQPFIWSSQCSFSCLEWQGQLYSWTLVESLLWEKRPFMMRAFQFPSLHIHLALSPLSVELSLLFQQFYFGEWVMQQVLPTWYVFRAWLCLPSILTSQSLARLPAQCFMLSLHYIQPTIYSTPSLLLYWWPIISPSEGVQPPWESPFSQIYGHCPCLLSWQTPR